MKCLCRASVAQVRGVSNRVRQTDRQTEFEVYHSEICGDQTSVLFSFRTDRGPRCDIWPSSGRPYTKVDESSHKRSHLGRVDICDICLATGISIPAKMRHAEDCGNKCVIL